MIPLLLSVVLCGQTKGLDPKLQNMKGRFWADRDFSTMAKVDSLSADQIDTYTGNVFVKIENPKNGRKYFKRHYRKGMYVTAQDSPFPPQGENRKLTEFLKTVPKGTEIRVCPENFQRFRVNLPDDASKLTHFTGSLTKETSVAFEKVVTYWLKDGMLK